MKKVRIIFETDEKSVGYIIDTESNRLVSGDFNDDCSEILNVSQQGSISNIKEFCQQISWTILTALKK